MYRQSLLKLEPYTQFIDIPSAMTLVGRFSATESMNELQLQRRCILAVLVCSLLGS